MEVIGKNLIKKKRGRPFGGKHPEVIREYWRMTQAANRKLKESWNKE